MHNLTSFRAQIVLVPPFGSATRHNMHSVGGCGAIGMLCMVSSLGVAFLGAPLVGIGLPWTGWERRTFVFGGPGLYEGRCGLKTRKNDFLALEDAVILGLLLVGVGALTEFSKLRFVIP